MLTSTYQERRGQLLTYFDRTAAEAWSRLTADAPVSGIRATVRAGRDEMRNRILGWLPADMRGELDNAMREATVFANDSAEKDNGGALAEMRASGKVSEFITLTADQKASWRKALAPVTEQMTSRVGKDTIDEFMKETGQATH